MYAQEQPTIAAWAQRNPDNFARVLQFVIISARQKFYNVPALMAQARDGGPDAMQALYGWKLRAYNEFWENREAIFWNCNHIAETYDCPDMRADFMLAYLAGLYGLGFAKAGFVCQLVYGISGCLDSVNLQRLSLPPYVARGRIGERPMSLRTIARRVATYNAAVRHAGGTEKLWDDWCAAIAQRYPEPFPTAESVSRFHLNCLYPMEG